MRMGGQVFGTNETGSYYSSLIVVFVGLRHNSRDCVVAAAAVAVAVVVVVVVVVKMVLVLVHISRDLIPVQLE